MVAAAARDGVLRGEAGRGDLECGAHVVVEPADEAPIFLVEDAAEFELTFYGGVVGLAFVAKMIGDVGQLGDDALLAFELGGENAGRIGVDAALGIGGEVVFYFFEGGFE